MDRPIFPPELEREIFETTAVLHPQTMPSLLRVARRVLIWIEPLLYTVLMVAEGFDLVHRPMDDDDVLRAMRVKPPSFFAANVRAMCFSAAYSDLSMDEVQALLRLCTNLVSLFVVGVRRWKGSLWALFGRNNTVDLNHPFLFGLTHLDIFNANAKLLHIPGLATLTALPALTHVSLGLNDVDVTGNTIRRVLEQYPQLQVLVHQIMPAYTRDPYGDLAREMAQITARPPAENVRFVTVVYENMWHDWEVGARGN
ncbi:hypothetical protein DFH07DRAFT_958467 [Mycena maculata]|uniref:Uncharacterized protein n=1 Tax=Mycena maculata TaxID=230809 RepID=A0AAD7J805_9AGAR|nr:hypothetical protein DFH07DRAFT_958467 [Mycena maculata]